MTETYPHSDGEGASSETEEALGYDIRGLLLFMATILINADAQYTIDRGSLSSVCVALTTAAPQSQWQIGTRSRVQGRGWPQPEGHSVQCHRG